jgi:hypothetical protein
MFAPLYTVEARCDPASTCAVKQRLQRYYLFIRQNGSAADKQRQQDALFRHRARALQVEHPNCLSEMPRGVKRGRDAGVFLSVCLLL